jgi:DNA-binding transcriptional regulator YdaS (Cro superfamily)
MTKDEVIRHFGSVSATARALGIRQPSVTNWGKFPPADRQLQIQLVTGGKLRAEDGAIDSMLGIKKVNQG